MMMIRPREAPLDSRNATHSARYSPTKGRGEPDVKEKDT
jgi:hypothetical protein